jgi:hypothetical protein
MQIGKCRFGLTILVWGLAVFLPAANLFAQGTRGNITGTVADPTGAAVPGALIVATNTATNVSTSTTASSTGDYSVPLYPAAYRIVVESPGFKRYVRENVTVTAGATVRLDPQLEVGSVTETVEVSGSLLTVQSENAKITTAVENKFVDELPLVVGGAMRSPFDLVRIGAQVMQRGPSNMSIGGGQARSWDATLDGLSVGTNRAAEMTEIAYNTPSLEAITDFAVDSGGFKAEYGFAGGGVITFSSKSGTNDIHGTVFNFLRNEKLDARGFFPTQRSIYKQNDFGVSIGGPVSLPKIYSGRNRTFFFGAYEGFRNRVGANDIILSVPTPEMYEGDFSNWVNPAGNLLTVYDPETTRPNPAGSGFIRTPFPDNRIPVSRFSQLARSIAPFGQQHAVPNRAGPIGTVDYVRNNFITTSGTIVEPQDKASVRIDHLITANHRLAYFANISSFRRRTGPGGPPGLPVPLWNGQVQDFDTQQHRISYDWIISPSTINHFSIGGNKFFKDSFSPSWAENNDWSSRIGCFPNVVDCERNFPQINFTEFQNWGGAARNGTGQPHWALKNDLTWNRRNHTFKFGFAFQSQRANGFGEQCIMGCADFSFLSTGIPANTQFISGSSFASFLLGHAIAGGTETVRFVEQTYNYYGFYAQDDWRLSRKLTLNLGLRYDYTAPPFSPKDEYSDFTPDRPNPAVNGFPGALRFAGFGPGTENRRSLVPSWWGGIGPRIGLAYAVNNKTTLRTAFGRSFSRVTVVAGSGHFAGFIGHYRFSSVNQGVTPTFTLDQGLPSYPLPPILDPAFSNNQNVDHWQPRDAARAPENFYWTFNIQREIAANTVIEVGYSATVGTHLQAGLVNLNQVPTAIWNDYAASLGPTQARNLFTSAITSPLARQLNVPIPYPNFTDPQVQQVRSVAQALRPYPQYLSVNTGAQGGDKSGHSTYHSFILKATRRYSSGLAFEWNYVLSKLLTDAHNYNAPNNQSMDQYNRRLEKSIGEFDQTHLAKFSTVYELPFGRGKRWGSGSHRLLRGIFGDWRVSATQFYGGGFPISPARNNPLPIFNGFTRPVVDSYDNWRPAVRGSKFDPAVDRFLDVSVFPAQPLDFGNATRFNPKVRTFPIFSENLSVAKSFHFTEASRLDFRWEFFDMFNRTAFNPGNTNINNINFGVVTSQANDPRRMQVGLKLYW